MGKIIKSKGRKQKKWFKSRNLGTPTAVTETVSPTNNTESPNTKKEKNPRLPKVEEDTMPNRKVSVVKKNQSKRENTKLPRKSLSDWSASNANREDSKSSADVNTSNSKRKRRSN